MSKWINTVKCFLSSHYVLLLIFIVLAVEPTVELWAMRNTDNETRNWILPALCVSGVGITFIILRRIGYKVLVSTSSFWATLLFSITCNLLLNREITQQTHQLCNALLLTSGLVFASYAVLRRFFALFWIPLIFVLTVQYAAMSMYGIDLNPVTLAQVFNATASEVLTYLTWYNGLLIILLVTATWLCCYGLHKIMKREHSITLLSAAAICFTSLYVARYYMQPVFYNQDCGLWPAKAIKQLGSRAMQGVKENDEIRNQVYALPSAADKPSSSKFLTGKEGVTIVLHIGESITSDHLPSHGYKRNTTPFLQKQQNIINFKDCTASSIYTVYSMVTILTDARRGYNFCKEKKMAPSVSSFGDLLIKHTFKQYCLFAHGTMIHTAGQNTLPKILLRLTANSTATYSNTGLPKEQIPQLQSILKKDSNSNKLILINNEGSHAPFSFYDPEKAPYKTEEMSNASDEMLNAQKMIDDYDNTIRYTDEYIEDAVTSLKGTPFIYIYISDHGEYLGENGQWNRSAGDTAEYFFASQGCRIPFFIIYSPEFRDLHPHFAEAIGNLHKNAELKTGHEHIFHTILGITGINSPYYNEELDLSSPKATPYSGPHP